MNFNYLLTSLTLAAGLFSNSAWSDIETIDLVAVYPLSIASSGPAARIANMERYANKTLDNSKAKAKTDYDTLKNLPDNPVTQNWRSKYGADLVNKMASTSLYCDVDYVSSGYNRYNDFFSKTYNYSAVGHNCISSFIHELGHNLTLEHSQKQDSSGELYAWGRGHSVDKAFVTTMAYNNAFNALWIQMFPRPDLNTCKDRYCGSTASAKEVAEAVKDLGIANSKIPAWVEPTISTITLKTKPTANDNMDTTDQRKAITNYVPANDVYSGQDSLTVDNAGSAKHGTVTEADNTFLYTPDKKFSVGMVLNTPSQMVMFSLQQRW